MSITLQQLTQLFPQTKASQLAKYVDPLNKCFTKYTIITPLRERAFLAQVGYECENFNVFEENLNYSAQGLLAEFPHHFNATTAAQYARKPQMIANHVYANRMGNGDEASGDGWKYHGRGAIQLTGSINYHAFSDYLEMLPMDETISYLGTPEGQIIVAGWFWNTRNLNRWADGQDMLTITRLINGGTNGYSGRMDIYNRSKSIIH